MIDAHCHLQASSDFPIGRRHILADFDEKFRDRMLNLARDHANTFCVIGTHPWQVDQEESMLWIDKIDKSFIAEHSIVGIGEVGFDFIKAKSALDRERQAAVFNLQIAVANKLSLPMVLHCVKAHQELLLAISSFKYGGIIHGFRSSYEIGKGYLDAGFLISIGDAIHAKTGAKLRAAVRKLGIGNIVIESDAHLLEHARLDKIVQTLAEIFKLDIEDIEMKLDKNLEGVFPEVKND